ncbi:MAG TPA: EAL domain-containing protein [Xanthobacteraceae bacterium]|nr:EAL domain-containing protein [Xanthobacteraceae bacterium]
MSQVALRGVIVHRLLAQQLVKATDEFGSIDLKRLCDLVGGAYEELDRDGRRTDRSMALMIEEIDTINRNLEHKVVERTRELRAREADLHAQNMRFDAAVSNMSQGLVMFDRDACLVFSNQRYIDMYSLKQDDVRLGFSLRRLIDQRIAGGTFSGDPAQYVDNLLASIKAGTPTSQHVELDDGRTIAMVNQPMAGGGWVATHEDISERRRAEMKVAHMARHDALTDLPNRVLLCERLSEALVHVERGQRLAVLCLDLDGFKNVNDTLGHPTGDELLRSVAARLRTCVRETDTISRVGGDEFSIIQTDIADATDAERLARRLSETISAPYDLHGHLVMINTSIGIALAPTDGTDPNELLKNADMALYGAKADGRGIYRFFEPSMDARMKARRTLELALRMALQNGEFEMYYQPVVNLSTDNVRCCEALIRWHHPERGIVSPDEFIPLAEEIGLIVTLGEWVIRRSCQDAATWPDEICVAINLSPTQLASKNLLPTVLSALATSQLSAHRLELEITEAVLMQNTEATLKTLHQLRALGIGISMDDFGTGYSSLSYLRSFPFDKIKIDRCFISGLGGSSESAAIVQAVAGLAKSLSMTTTAEGVETCDQLDSVRELGCTYVQGYLYSPPVPNTELFHFFGRQVSKREAAA